MNYKILLLLLQIILINSDLKAAALARNIARKLSRLLSADQEVNSNNLFAELNVFFYKFYHI